MKVDFRVRFMGYRSLVGREGFEPPKDEPPDLQSGAFGRFATDPIVCIIHDLMPNFEQEFCEC